MNIKKLLIVEDQAMVSGALEALLNLEEDFQVIAKATDGQDALAQLEQLGADQRPDIVITDIEMPRITGLELSKIIRDQYPNIKVIILTTFARAGYLRRAMEASVKGYLLKDAPSETLAHALRQIDQGKIVVDPELITDAWVDLDPLTDRQRQLLRLAYEGLSTEDIVQKMNLSSGTVRNYLSSAVSKLGAKNRIDAARIARQKGWL